MTDQHRARLRELKMDRVQMVVEIAIEEALIYEGEERRRGQRHHLRIRMLWIAHPMSCSTSVPRTKNNSSQVYRALC